MPMRSQERHRTGRIGWLRAAVLGANDGILSTSSLVLGVAAAHATHSNVLVAGVAGLVAGAMSMAAGEYVSVHSQADTEELHTYFENSFALNPARMPCTECLLACSFGDGFTLTPSAESGAQWCPVIRAI